MKSFKKGRYQIGMAAMLVMAAECSRTPRAEENRLAANAEFASFLRTYDSLKPDGSLEGEALTFIRKDAEKNLHRYVGVIVEPVKVYLAADGGAGKLTEGARATAASYFHHALISAVSDAFPVVDQPGPLVLRLRSALIGVGAGGELVAGDPARTLRIDKVGVEMELVDSETGQQVAAMVDRGVIDRMNAELGQDIREARWSAARDAFDEWARRVRRFLDAAHELQPEDAARATASYRPY